MSVSDGSGVGGPGVGLPFDFVFDGPGTGGAFVVGGGALVVGGGALVVGGGALVVGGGGSASLLMPAGSGNCTTLVSSSAFFM